MKRSILLSLMVIGAVTALLGAAWAANFTASDSDDGDITATTLSIEVTGSGSLVFDCANVVPGDTCDDLVKVQNNSGADVEITAVTVTPSGDLHDACGNGANLSTNELALQTAWVGDTISGGGAFSSTEILEVTFDPTGAPDQASIDACQGETGTITITVTVQAP